MLYGAKDQLEKYLRELTPISPPQQAPATIPGQEPERSEDADLIPEQ
jgi:hypothetical protein